LSNIDEFVDGWIESLIVLTVMMFD